MLNVYVDQRRAGRLFASQVERHQYFFNYDSNCPASDAVSLTMPVVRDPYSSLFTLHPIFDMNLPEGDLAQHLRKQFSKALPDFDELTLLKIVGQSQIGRLRFTTANEPPIDVPEQNLNDLLTYNGAEDLFTDLLQRYTTHSGISGAQPKVMVRSAQGRISHKGATHIVKTWHADQYPQLAANEYFCMRAALHSGLSVPHFALSDNAQFLIIERFDLAQDHYLGFEDFCVLNGKTSAQKYQGSYENICKRIKDFVSPPHIRPALEQFFKALVLSCAIQNGDAHLKNFGVLYEHVDAPVRLSPIYDLVSTTPYHPNDSLALTLGGSKRWPKASELIRFARTQCDLSDKRTQEIMAEVQAGLAQAQQELGQYLSTHPKFKTTGNAMLKAWAAGQALFLHK